jgi:hypothetical protein
MSNLKPLTTTDIIAYTTNILESNKFCRIQEKVYGSWTVSNARLFEDEYHIVAIIGYETWNDLQNNWSEAQSELVQLISQNMSTSDPKAWDGYLVIFTPCITDPRLNVEVNEIRYNVSRVRKLIATGNDLMTEQDVYRFLQPLLPLENEESLLINRSSLDVVADMLQEKGISRNDIDIMIKAFKENKPMMESLYKYRVKNEN